MNTPIHPNSPVRPFIAYFPLPAWPLLLIPAFIWLIAMTLTGSVVLAAGLYLLKFLGFWSLTGSLIWLGVVNMILYLASAAIAASDFHTSFKSKLTEKVNLKYLIIGLPGLLVSILEMIAYPLIWYLTKFRDSLWQKFYYGPA